MDDRTPVQEGGVLGTVQAHSVIDKFNKLADDDGPKVGDTLADEVFAQDRIAYFSALPFRGPEEIRGSRKNAWQVIATRRHKILKVYTSDQDGSDLLFVAHVEMGLRNGKTVDGEFAGRLVVADPHG
ncbi:5PTase [Zalerion maritima]|uniref:5PTase n=1 Tax=Zalerion maritima TaxID=339359 RepID=A0AAD5RKQ5_9PEZI|nr:5PTase [Zalerion maritima]